MSKKSATKTFAIKDLTSADLEMIRDLFSVKIPTVQNSNLEHVYIAELIADSDQDYGRPGLSVLWEKIESVLIQAGVDCDTSDLVVGQMTEPILTLYDEDEPADDQADDENESSDEED